AGLDLDTVLATVTSIAVPALGQAALVRTADRHGAVTARAASIHHEDPAWEARLREHATEAVQALDATLGDGQVLRTGRSRRVVVDPVAPGARSGGRAAELGLTGALCVPLRAHGRVFGELQVLSQSPEPYTDEDLALAEELADRAALALDNAVLYTEQREAAVALQQVLLTPAPQPDDLGIAVRYLPATAHADVGGDWYDAFVRTDGTTLVVIGDVVGHDLHAAAGMGQVRSMLRVLGYQSDGTPADVLSAVDRAVSGLGVATMATAVLARVEQTPAQAAAGERTVRWSNAGHPPPLLLHADGEVEVLSRPSDPLIGLGPDFRRADHEHPLPTGSTLVLYTDGLVERRGQHLGVAITALARTLRGLAGLPLEELCDALLERTLPGAHEDDVALLALRARPAGERD
ncbi:MAG: Serine phosphatase RsbU, regulator of sigma subunit, partial [uncultured Quadrisphaera sp.]